MSFNVLKTNAVDLQQSLSENKLTSVEVVQQYFAQTDRHESELNAFISPAPRDKVLRVAKALDEERHNGQLRSALHGVPIVLKVCIGVQRSVGLNANQAVGLLHHGF